ncbi:hypothetical protein SAMN05192555_11954 [Franzmannia pantelleriensis]|uniref:Uncharacterized protein n=2 Tax=Franzmannia pantelleriensis TaxID=48727 RepID=A0A1G9W1K6_9GAMM|nr:hypothetical protein [Halomonas pantelleriensis]SDM78412.1 hypothetical protein SAMN05192555_11954 [Halomonas pantelleriensis]
MKINVEFDLTPQEFRQAMGLPDVEAFQNDLMARIQQQMENGAEGYDPMSLMQPFLQQPFFKEGMQQPFMKDSMAQSLASFGSYQQMMLDMLRQAASSGGKPQEQPTEEGDEQKASPRGKASASPRAKRK